MSKPTVVSIPPLSGTGNVPSVQIPLGTSSAVTLINLDKNLGLTLCTDDSFTPNTTWPLPAGNVIPQPGIDNLWVQNTNTTAVNILVLQGIVPVDRYYPGGNPVSGYASLTGPGETVTPGDLTQLGGFTITSSSAMGINLTDNGAGGIQITETGSFGIYLVSSSGIQLNDSYGIQLNETGGSGILVTANGSSIGIAANAGGSIALTSDGGFGVTDNAGISLIENGAGGINIQDNGSGGITIGSAGGNININTVNNHFISHVATGTAGNAQIYMNGINPSLQLSLNGTVGAYILLNGNAGVSSITINSDKLAFYNATPVLQASHPATLTDVITLLTNLGLCA